MKWTVYSEEKPQMVGSYLVTHTTDSGRYYVDYDYWTVSDKFKYHPTDVVAWMPFPKPYSKTEPQYDFGEYADRLWKIAYERGKREALEQTEPSCNTCKLKDTTEWCKRQEVCRAYEPKDEPRTDCAWK